MYCFFPPYGALSVPMWYFKIVHPFGHVRRTVGKPKYILEHTHVLGSRVSLRRPTERRSQNDYHLATTTVIKQYKRTAASPVSLWYRSAVCHSHVHCLVKVHGSQQTSQLDYLSYASLQITFQLEGMRLSAGTKGPTWESTCSRAPERPSAEGDVATAHPSSR